MNPLRMDTDQDSLIDPYDPQPIKKNNMNMGKNLLDVIRIIQVGAAYRDTGKEGGYFHYLVGDYAANSPFYVMGSKMPDYVDRWVEIIYNIFKYEAGDTQRIK